ncbi:MAG TPA: acyl-CoA dehydrogenase [Geobacteraceae bacterium]
MFLLIVLAACWILAYHRARLALWTAVLAVLTALWSVAGHHAPWRLAIVWLIFLAFALILNKTALRRQFISRRIYLLFRRLLPSLSRTEREALEAGTVWWDGELLSGSPDWQKLLSLPKPQLSAEEEAFLSGPVEELCAMLDDWRIVTELHDLPPEAWRFIREKGFFGMIIPKEYGGLGFSPLAHSQVVVKIASRSVTAAVTVMVPNSLGPAELLLRYGTREQQEYYLPRLARGEEIPCFALTGPEAGSDAASIPDTGVVCRGDFGGEETVGIRLNWEKRYITLGPVATVIGLAFRLFDPEHLLGDNEEPGITLALVPTSLPGITIGSRHSPLGIPFQNGPNTGRDVFIPVDWIIGGRGKAGHGWRMLMEGLAAGRSISLPALSTGGGKLTARAVGAFARVRRQFRLPIGRFEGVAEALAEIAGNVYLLDAARTLTCAAVAQGERPAVVSAIVKYQSTERLRRIINRGMDVSGGSGISLGPRNLLALIHQSSPIGITVEGANILTRSMIIFGQGLIRCHPYVLGEMRSVANMDEGAGLAEFDRLLAGHVSFALANGARALFHGLTGGYALKAPDTPCRRHFQVATRLSAAFALATDITLLSLGGSLKRHELISGRMADILGNLYLASALLKQFEERGRPVDELPLLEWGFATCLGSIGEAFAGVIANLPVRPAAWLLRVLAFPLGLPKGGPDDSITLRTAGLLLEPSAARDRLTAGIYLPRDPREPLGRLEDALIKVIAAEAVEQKLRDAVKSGGLSGGSDMEVVEAALAAKIITGADADILTASWEARRETTRVDDFPQL